MFDIVGLTEIFHIHKNITYDIPGYHPLEYNMRQNTQSARGGVGMYIRDNINFTNRTDISVFIPHVFESLFIEIKTKKNTSMIIGTIYRPNTEPKADIDIFQHTLFELIDTLKRENTPILLVGDFNIDLLKFETHEKTHNFLEDFFSNGFIPLITKPTRVYRNSATLIDHIFTNNLKMSHESGIILTDIADHFGTYTIMHKLVEAPKPKYISFRSFKDDSIIKFRTLLSTEDFSHIETCDCPGESYSNFMRIYTKRYDEAFPLKTLKINRKLSKREHWMTSALLTSWRNKDKLYRKQLKKPTQTNITKYKTYCSIFNKTKRAAKKVYFNTFFNNNKSNVKATWSMLKQITNKNSKSHSLPSSLIINNKLSSNTSEIANGFNNFFSIIGQKVSDSVPPSTSHFSSHLKGHYPQSLYLIPTTENEIKDIAKTLKPKLSQGHDNISTKLLKNTIDIIAKPLAHIYNQSFVNGIVPSDMKIAKVVPIFKSGENISMNNYRPISLLPAFSKLLEKLVCKRLTTFLEQNKILYEHQYCFRKKNTTIHPIMHFMKHISSNNDKISKDLTLAVFLDLSKAFDTICHNTLLHKLNFYGIRGVCNDWFRSYLQNRQQYVTINSAKSQLKETTCGVPQGSILGPILFIIYMNDINASTSLKLLSYADDTTIYSSHTEVTKLFSNLNNELPSLDDWFRANKLALNVKKTKFSIFSPQKVAIDEQHILTLNNSNILRENPTKFLGLHIDEQLTWTTHINKIKSKLASSLFIINRAKHFLPHEALKSIYYTLIHSHLIYGIAIWGNSSHVHKLFTMQKKAIRIINNKSKNSHTEPLFKRENILKIQDLYSIHACLLAYDYIHTNLPPSFNEFFSAPRHNAILTRQQNFLGHPRPRTQFSAKAPNHAIPHIWNLLDNDTRTIPLRNQLKSLLTKQKITSYADHIECDNPTCPDCNDQ